MHHSVSLALRRQHCSKRTRWSPRFDLPGGDQEGYMRQNISALFWDGYVRFYDMEHHQCDYVAIQAAVQIYLSGSQRRVRYDTFLPGLQQFRLPRSEYFDGTSNVQQ